MIEDIRVVEWVEEYTWIGEGGSKLAATKDRYDIQVRYSGVGGVSEWEPIQRVSKEDTEK